MLVNGADEAELKQLIALAQERLRTLEAAGVNVTILHIYREFNTLADGLANEVLDSGWDITESWFLD